MTAPTPTSRDIPHRQFILSVGTGLVFLAVIVLAFLLWQHHLDQQHDLRTRRVTACQDIADAANRTLCIVESK